MRLRANGKRNRNSNRNSGTEIAEYQITTCRCYHCEKSLFSDFVARFSTMTFVKCVRERATLRECGWEWARRERNLDICQILLCALWSASSSIAAAAFYALRSLFGSASTERVSEVRERAVPWPLSALTNCALRAPLLLLLSRRQCANLNNEILKEMKSSVCGECKLNAYSQLARPLALALTHSQ